MPILGIGLHVIVAIFFAIHAIRTRQEMYWLFVLLFFPLLGSLIYALAIWFPDISNSRAGRRTLRSLRAHVDPGRDVRDAREALEVSDAVQNRLRMADALLAAGKPDEAEPIYAKCLQGVYRDNADITLRHARALLEIAQPEKARDVLDALRASQPNLKSRDGHLLYARAMAACGDKEAAKHEFDALIDYWASLEPRAWYADVLADWGDTQAARALADEAMQTVKRMPRHARELNAEWIHRLRRHAA